MLVVVEEVIIMVESQTQELVVDLEEVDLVDLEIALIIVLDRMDHLVNLAPPVLVVEEVEVLGLDQHLSGGVMVVLE
tara:strand:+ start:132 stop:362 length:231 start_codon:yes stop_codon:yes gene_type:complete